MSLVYQGLGVWTDLQALRVHEASRAWRERKVYPEIPDLTVYLETEVSQARWETQDLRVPPVSLVREVCRVTPDWTVTRVYQAPRGTRGYRD